MFILVYLGRRKYNSFLRYTFLFFFFSFFFSGDKYIHFLLLVFFPLKFCKKKLMRFGIWVFDICFPRIFKCFYFPFLNNIIAFHYGTIPFKLKATIIKLAKRSKYLIRSNLRNFIILLTTRKAMSFSSPFCRHKTLFYGS